MSAKALNIPQFVLYGLLTSSFALPIAYFWKKKHSQSDKPKKPQSSLTVVADIGGTNSRFQLIEVDVTMLKPNVLLTRKYSSKAFNSFSTIFEMFLQECKQVCDRHPDNAVIGMAGPVKNNTVIASNVKVWGVLNGDELAKEFKLKSFTFLNDFEAIAYSILKLQRHDYVQINEGVQGCENEKIAVQGPGTGLGYCSIIPAPFKNGIRYYVWGGEGGHASFCPTNELQCEYMLWFR